MNVKISFTLSSNYLVHRACELKRRARKKNATRSGLESTWLWRNPILSESFVT